MEINPNKKYAIVPMNQIAIPLEKLADLMEHGIAIERGYESGHGYRFSIETAQQKEIMIVEGEQILTDTAIKRMSEGTTS